MSNPRVPNWQANATPPASTITARDHSPRNSLSLTGGISSASENAAATTTPTATARSAGRPALPPASAATADWRESSCSSGDSVLPRPITRPQNVTKMAYSVGGSSRWQATVSR